MTCKAQNDGNGYVHCCHCGTTDHEFYFHCNRQEAPLAFKIMFVSFLILVVLAAIVALNPQYIFDFLDFLENLHAN